MQPRPGCVEESRGPRMVWYSDRTLAVLGLWSSAGKFRQRVNDSAQLARFTSTTGEPGGSRPPAPSGPVRQRLRHGFGGIGERLVAVGLAFGEDDVAGCIRNDDACILAGTRRNEVPPALAPEGDQDADTVDMRVPVLVLVLLLVLVLVL